MRFLKYFLLCGLVCTAMPIHPISLAQIKNKIYEWRWPIGCFAALCAGSYLERHFGTPEWSRFTLSLDPKVTTDDTGRKSHGNIAIYNGKELHKAGAYVFGRYDGDSTKDGVCTQTGDALFTFKRVISEK